MSGNISARICLPYFLLISEPRKKTWSCLVWNENLKEHRNKETFSNYIRPKKKSCFRKYGWREKFSSGGRISFFNRFSEDISFLLKFLWLFLVLVFFLFFFGCFLKLKMYILIHIRLCRQVSDKKFFTPPISGTKTAVFFGLSADKTFYDVF